MILGRQILPDSANTLLKMIAPNGQRKKVSAVARHYNEPQNRPSGAQGLPKSSRGGHFLEVLKPTSALEAPRTPPVLLLDDFLCILGPSWPHF